MAKPCDDLGDNRPEFQSLCRSVIKHVPEILALLDADGKILYVNPQTEKVLGYRQDDVEGRDIFEFVHPADLHRARQEFSVTLRQEGEQIPSFLRIRDNRGDWIPFEIIANNRVPDPETRAVIFTARDLRFRKEIEAAISRANADTEAEVAKRTTELTKINAELRIENQARRQAENRLQHTISLLHATFDSTADGILVVSLDGKVTSCNKKFAEMWRLDCGPSLEKKEDEALLARVSDQLQRPADFLDKVRQLYADPAATSFDVLFFRDGRIFERYSQPQLLDQTINGRVWSFRDVTGARNLEAELRQSQKMEALGKLAGGVAHDFNNLLTLITGYASLATEQTSIDEARNLAQQILATTKRAASLTKQLLTFSRKQPEAPITVDLNSIVMNLELMLRRLLADEIQLEVSLAPDPQPVFVDVPEIELMVLNLAVNAQDAMPEGGRLSLRTYSTSVLPEGHLNEKPQPFVVLEVSDTGHGMTPEVQERIFEPFYTTKQVGRGTGFGLSTVSGIAKRAHGKVEVKSEPNQGATFRVYLPRFAAPAPRVSAPSVSVPQGGNETILLAEDESGIRSMTRAYLESLGYRVLEAADGEEAIARSSEYAGTIDLLLTDLHMPNRRGDSVVEVVRRDRPGIKAIFMSGYVDDQMAQGVENLLYKPFTLPELGQQVRFVLDSNSRNQARHIDPAA